MQYSNTLSVISTLLFSAAKLSSAADMSQYDPQAGVQPEFEAFLKTFVSPLPHAHMYIHIYIYDVQSVIKCTNV